MRATFVHSFYSSSAVSGENLAVAAQLAALRSAGHQVDLAARYTDDMAMHPRYRTASAIRVGAGWDVGADELPVCEGPEHVLHIHNLFPNFGHRWIRHWRGPVVATLHNFRTWCANGLLLREGKICTLCPDGRPHQSVRYSCYHGSSLQTLPLAAATWKPEKFNSILTRADSLIAQTERMREFLLSRGVPIERVSFIPGFVDSAMPEHSKKPPRGWVFVGRLTAEKGLRELLAAWPHEESLDVVGDGPESRWLPHGSESLVRHIGFVHHDEVLRRLPLYEGLVFPGRCWEGAYPMVVREAMACGLPVVAAAGSSAADFVRRYGGGVVYQDDNPPGLAMALRSIRHGGEAVRREAVAASREQFGIDRWVRAMETVYDQCISSSATKR